MAAPRDIEYELPAHLRFSYLAFYSDAVRKQLFGVQASPSPVSVCLRAEHACAYSQLAGSHGSNT